MFRFRLWAPYKKGPIRKDGAFFVWCPDAVDKTPGAFWSAEGTRRAKCMDALGTLPPRFD